MYTLAATRGGGDVAFRRPSSIFIKRDERAAVCDTTAPTTAIGL